MLSFSPLRFTTATVAPFLPPPATRALRSQTFFPPAVRASLDGTRSGRSTGTGTDSSEETKALPVKNYWGLWPDKTPIFCSFLVWRVPIFITFIFMCFLFQVRRQGDVLQDGTGSLAEAKDSHSITRHCAQVWGNSVSPLRFFSKLLIHIQAWRRSRRGGGAGGIHFFGEGGRVNKQIFFWYLF